MAGRVSVALAAGRRASRLSPALSTVVLVAGSPAAREAASGALCPPWARAAAGLGRGREFCSAGAGESNAVRCAACGTALSANWTQGLLNAAVRPARDGAAARSRRAAALPYDASGEEATSGALGHLDFRFGLRL